MCSDLPASLLHAPPHRTVSRGGGHCRHREPGEKRRTQVSLGDRTEREGRRGEAGREERERGKRRRRGRDEREGKEGGRTRGKDGDRG